MPKWDVNRGRISGRDAVSVCVDEDFSIFITSPEARRFAADLCEEAACMDSDAGQHEDALESLWRVFDAGAQAHAERTKSGGPCEVSDTQAGLRLVCAVLRERVIAAAHDIPGWTGEQIAELVFGPPRPGDVPEPVPLVMAQLSALTPTHVSTRDDALAQVFELARALVERGCQIRIDPEKDMLFVCLAPARGGLANSQYRWSEVVDMVDSINRAHVDPIADGLVTHLRSKLEAPELVGA